MLLRSLRVLLMLVLTGNCCMAQDPESQQIELRVWPRFARVIDNPPSGVTHADASQPLLVTLTWNSNSRAAVDLSCLGCYPLQQEIRKEDCGNNQFPAFPTEILMKPTNLGWSTLFLVADHPFLALGFALLLGGWGRAAWKRRAHQQKLARYEDGRDRHDSLVMQTVGGYRLVKILGSGGMATVYLGLPEKTLDESQARAVKILSREVFHSADFRARFEREVKAYQKLSHPNIVRLYDWSVPDEQNQAPYMMLELIRGQTLRQIFAGRALPWEKAGPYLEQMFKAVHYAHQQGIVHRDLKPENVMLEESGRLVVMDFGLARPEEVAEQLTATGTILGTPSYIAPEQLAGGEVTPRLDQFALGAITYEMLTGCLPHEGRDVMEILAKVMSAPARPMREIKEDLPAGADEVVLRMLSKDPSQRFTDVASAWQALQQSFRISSS